MKYKEICLATKNEIRNIYCHNAPIKLHQEIFYKSTELEANYEKVRKETRS